MRGKSAVLGKAGRGTAGAMSPGVVGIGKNVSGGLDVAETPRAQLADLIQKLKDQMLAAAREQFKVTARIRDEVGELKRQLRGWARAWADLRSSRHHRGFETHVPGLGPESVPLRATQNAE